MAYAAAADLIARKDARTLGALVSDDGTLATGASLETHTNLLAALDDASGEIEAALLQGKRYAASDLAALTGNSLAYLKRITCDIAFWMLWERRPAYDDDPKRDAARERAKKAIDMLRTGQHVFDVDDVKEAGLPTITGPTRVQLQNLNLAVDQARGHYYPARRLPGNR